MWPRLGQAGRGGGLRWSPVAGGRLLPLHLLHLLPRRLLGRRLRVVAAGPLLAVLVLEPEMKQIGILLNSEFTDSISRLQKMVHLFQKYLFDLCLEELLCAARGV